ncbi:MAG: DUF362 domain-containing protein [Candidatus Omnitrophica bacterium]|nr:DUF362 domain-containing protein [Candidatus Omnitrophota bacterium]
MSKVYFAKIKNKESVFSVARKAAFLLKKIDFLDSIGKKDFIAVKTHFGEVDNIGHISPKVIKNIVSILKGRSDRVFLIETNTLYMGRRANSAEHIMLAEKHGFGIRNIGAPIIIADGLKGRGFNPIEVDGTHFKKVKIASDLIDYDFMVCLSHITGHMQSGFGGAIKNLGMGCASRAGKLEQHSNVLPSISQGACIGCGICAQWCPEGAIDIKNGKAAIDENKCIGCGECTVICKIGAVEIKWSEAIKVFQEKLAEYALGASKAVGQQNICYINFINHITKDCDCMSRSEPPICNDIGILASKDPVALDQASVDMVIKNNGADVFKKGYPNIDWSWHLKHAERIGLGHRTYEIEECKAQRNIP